MGLCLQEWEYNGVSYDINGDHLTLYIYKWWLVMIKWCFCLLYRLHIYIYTYIYPRYYG